MALLPGWDSLETVSSIARVTTVAGIWILILLGLVDGIAYIYGSREKTLTTAAERAAASKRQHESAQERAAHEAQTDAIRRDLAQAREDADNAKREASAANQRSHSIEQRVAQRHLSPAQRQALLQAIQPFAGQKVSVHVMQGDLEAQTFAGDFVSLFRTAGWTGDVSAGDGINFGMGGPVIRGIEVSVSAQDADAGKVPSAFEPLVRTLMQLGLTSGRYKNPNLAPGAINVHVGTKTN